VTASAAVLRLVPTDGLRLTADGKIIDFLDPEVSRPNTPEERVRQEYGRKLHFEYGYPTEVIAFNVAVNIGSEVRYADIAVYLDSMAARTRDQGRIRFVVETKAPDEKSGIGQLKSYIMASAAEGGVWINQTDAPRYFRRVKNSLVEWPNIPHAEEEWESIGKHKKRQLRPPHNLVETFQRCHNALYKGGIDSEDLAMDMVRMILAKYRDEVNEGDTCEFRCTPLELQSREGRARVAERVRNLFVQVRIDNLDVFDEHEVITAGDREIAIVVAELQDFRFLPDDESGEVYDIVGAAYEVYVGSHLKGDRGQYFTHRLIVGLLVRLVDPVERDIIFDPAMGSGGFLIAAMRLVTQKIIQSNRNPHAKREALSKFHNRSIFGIDKSPKLVKVARTNMILASDGHSGLVHADSLSVPSSLPAAFLKKVGPGLPTVILTNPPFGATSEHRLTADREPEILAQFDLGHTWRRVDGELRATHDLSGEGVPPEYLFVERCIRWVAPGGKIGIVVPRGLLDNDKALSVRTLLLRECRALAVINCHDDTFKPYTDAKAALLVLEKKKTESVKEDDYSIFMAISQAIGHNGIGEPIYRTDAKGDLVMVEGSPVIEQDTDDIYQAWQAVNQGRKPGSEYYYTIKRRDINPQTLILNPVRYLPKYDRSRKQVLALGEQQGWSVERLGNIAQVYNGPRFKRPYADKGVTKGPKIVRYFTGNAVTQTRGENIKYLDLAKAKPNQLKMIGKLYLKRGMILITDAGTVGRVIYATAYHEGAVGTNNLIRVIVQDEALRGYVYQFLSSRLGQDQLKRNIYGAIVDHLEPDDVKDVLIPIPAERSTLEEIGTPTIRGMELQELAYAQMTVSRALIAESLQVDEDEDSVDANVARKRLKEIAENPRRLVNGEILEQRLRELLS
jgi:type I restriction enzyme M protein